MWLDPFLDAQSTVEFAFELLFIVDISLNFRTAFFPIDPKTRTDFGVSSSLPFQLPNSSIFFAQSLLSKNPLLAPGKWLGIT